MKPYNDEKKNEMKFIDDLQEKMKSSEFSTILYADNIHPNATIEDLNKFI